MECSRYSVGICCFIALSDIKHCINKYDLNHQITNDIKCGYYIQTYIKLEILLDGENKRFKNGRLKFSVLWFIAAAD